MNRLERERKTLEVMIGMYCRAHHGTTGGLCDDCGALWDYSSRRLLHCPFQAEKPTCARCPVHCYKPEMRERIRAVMRFSGPRMIWRHPILAVMHLIDESRAK